MLINGKPEAQAEVKKIIWLTSPPGVYPGPTLVAGKTTQLESGGVMVSAHCFLDWGDYLNINVHNMLQDNG